MSFSISSTSFDANQKIPEQYTCDDQDISPPLQWEGWPTETQSLVLIVEDPDAPDPAAPTMTWIHWVLYNLPVSCSGLAESVQDNDLPSGTLQGINSWGKTGYGGPCPPIGKHRYFFKLYAIDFALPDLHAPDKDELIRNMRGHVLEETVFMGTYQREKQTEIDATQGQRT